MVGLALSSRLLIPNPWQFPPMLGLFPTCCSVDLELFYRLALLYKGGRACLWLLWFTGWNLVCENSDFKVYVCQSFKCKDIVGREWCDLVYTYTHSYNHTHTHIYIFMYKYKMLNEIWNKLQSLLTCSPLGEKTIEPNFSFSFFRCCNVFLNVGYFVN